MNEKNSWNNFIQSGKISDYLKYTELKQEQITTSKVGNNATQDTRDNSQTAQYR